MTSRSWFRRFAFRWCVALVLHEALLHALTDSTRVATLFSPGPHSPLASLALATAFVVLRVFVVVLWPAALISTLLWLRERWSDARRTADIAKVPA